MSYCPACDKKTHTIEGEARRPLCHDCVNFKVVCQDKMMRLALNYGAKYLSQAYCMGGQGGIRDSMGRLIQPLITKYDHACAAFKQHSNAPRDGRPNPLTFQQRKEWREYLEMPSAFWLEPRRWEGVIDSHKQMFWDRQPERKGGAAKTLLGLGAIAVGLLASKKLVDGKKDPVTPEQTSGDHNT
jgi:hypothetical protein